MTDVLTIPIQLTSEGPSAPGELYALTLKLRDELLNRPVQSVTRPAAPPPADAPGPTKGIGPNETQLLVTLGTSVVPAIILLLSNWLIRQKDQRLHIKIGDAEVDIPRGMNPDEVEQYVKMVTRAAKTKK